MSEPQLERSVLEAKEREELFAIANALGTGPTSRARKSDLVRQILQATGVEAAGDEAEAAPAKRARTRRVVADANVGSEPDDAAPADPEAPPAAPEDPGPAAEADTAGPDPDPVSVVAEEPGARRAGGGRLSRPDGVARATQSDNGAPRANGSGPSPQPAPGNQAQASPGNHQAGPGNHQAGPGNQVQGGGNQAGAPASANGTTSGEDPSGRFDEPGNRRSRRRRGRDRVERVERVERELTGQAPDQPFSGEPTAISGFLDLRDEGYGFIRTAGYLPGPDDVYVSISQVRRFALRRGDQVEGGCRPAGGNERYPALLRVDTVNGQQPEEARGRSRFDSLTPVFPDTPLRLTAGDGTDTLTARVIELLAPVGRGQRGLIVSPPRAGKTTLVKAIAGAIGANNPDVHLMVVLIDERPEEVTDLRRSVTGEVVASTFDRPAEEHVAVAELAIERAKRLVELGGDVVVVLDGLTRLARAHHLAQPATGRVMPGGIDTGALYPPKRFFGAARNIEGGGSLTILATVLVETGSRMDEVIFEEFAGTANMELRLDRRLADARIYPAVDIPASATRHEDLLVDPERAQALWSLRRAVSGLVSDGDPAAGIEDLIGRIRATASNDEVLATLTPGA